MSTENEGAPLLTACPCGQDAAWYRVVLFAHLDPRKPAAGQAVTFMSADDFYEDLCDECFRQAIPPDERQGWKRLVTEQ